jgi:hypothetical protein
LISLLIESYEHSPNFRRPKNRVETRAGPKLKLNSLSEILLYSVFQFYEKIVVCFFVIADRRVNLLGFESGNPEAKQFIVFKSSDGVKAWNINRHK